jgi:prepilin-type N-terminal cleavage/methylation domain-containing protein
VFTRVHWCAKSPPHTHRRAALFSPIARNCASGFTALEMMVTVALVAVLAAMGLAAYDRLTSQATFSGVLGNLVTSLRRTRVEASGRGVATSFVIDTANNRWWGIEAPIGWTLDSFDPTAPGTVIVSGTFPTGSGKAIFGPATGYGSILPAPFATVPVISSQHPVLPYCSFCKQAGLGAIVFQPNGTASFSDGPSAPLPQGHQFTIQSPLDGRTVLIAVVARTGLVEVFER